MNYGQDQDQDQDRLSETCLPEIKEGFRCSVECTDQIASMTRTAETTSNALTDSSLLRRRFMAAAENKMDYRLLKSIRDESEKHKNYIREMKAYCEDHFIPQ